MHFQFSIIHGCGPFVELFNLPPFPNPSHSFRPLFSTFSSAVSSFPFGLPHGGLLIRRFLAEASVVDRFVVVGRFEACQCVVVDVAFAAVDIEVAVVVVDLLV